MIFPEAKPYSEACERNQAPILAVLREVLRNGDRVLEIGSGTGQHAVHFGAALPQVTWQTADLPDHHAGIRAWLAEARLPNVLAPLALNVDAFEWPSAAYDAVFSANTAHIMGWPAVQRMLRGAAHALRPGGGWLLYGPFRYGGRHTSESNARFDAALRAGDSAMGIRDFEALDAEARAAGLVLERDVALPANNRMLVWRKPGRNAVILGL
jgi:cyclopropane fatty-acyl-phospholipid synthase-like methyltransferase